MKKNNLTGGYNAGFSMIELLVVLLISLIILASVIQTVVGSKRNFIDQNEMAFIQQSARFTMDLLARDIRMAGYFGCADLSHAQKANANNDDVGGFISLIGLEGYDGSINTNSFPVAIGPKATVGTDAIMIRRISEDNHAKVSGQSGNSAADIDVYSHSFETGQMAVIMSKKCDQIGLFQITDASASAKIEHVQNNFAGGASVGGGNCTAALSGDFNCQDDPCDATSCPAGTINLAYESGSEIAEYLAHAYFIGDSAMLPGTPVLKRQKIVALGGETVTKEEELVIGVEDMELLYGIDSTGAAGGTNGDGVIDKYVSASDIDIAAPIGTIDEDDWERVLAVRVSLVFRSITKVNSPGISITLDGTPYADGYMRQVVKSTIKLRNQG